MGPIHTIDDVIDMLRRRWLVIVLVTGFGCALSLALALSQRHSYASSEVIQFTQPLVATELAPTTVQGSPARRLQLVEQAIMARDNVNAMIDELGLYTDRPGLTRNEKVALFRRNVRIDGVAGEDGAIAILRITATMDSPELARDVAREVSRRTIAMTVARRLDQARHTLDFFVAEERKLTDRIARLEDEIAQFRNANDIALEGGLEFRRAELATINESILTLDREIIAIQRGMEQIPPNTRQATRDRMVKDAEARIETLRRQRELLTGRQAELRQAIDAAPAVERELSVYQRQLQQLQAQLDAITVRRSEAEVGYKLEVEREGEQMTVLEEAALPEYPSSSSRKRKAALGGMISVALALLAAFLLDLRNPVIRSPEQMRREVGFEPIVTIPRVDLNAERRRNSRLARRAARSPAPEPERS